MGARVESTGNWLRRDLSLHVGHRNLRSGGLLQRVTNSPLGRSGGRRAHFRPMAVQRTCAPFFEDGPQLYDAHPPELAERASDCVSRGQGNSRCRIFYRG